MVFMFTGQGSQTPGMGRALYETCSPYRVALDECAQILDPLLSLPLLSLLYGDADPDGERINETVYTQPALFAVEYAMAQMWRAWGVEPACVNRETARQACRDDGTDSQRHDSHRR